MIPSDGLIAAVPKETDGFKLTYNFTSKEIAVLAKYMRNHQAELPEGIELFYKALETSVYNCLSLEEVRNFYS